MGPGVAAAFDTTILIDFLNGIPGASDAVASYERRFISVVTVIELLTGCSTSDEERAARLLLRDFRVARLTNAVVERAAVVRRETHLKLPDAIILATALELGCVLVTRNTKDFAADDPAIRVPYVL